MEQEIYEEKRVEIFLKQEFKDINFTHNAPISQECRYRPDFRYEISKEILLIIEVDENQHKCYKKDKEIQRMLEIQQAINSRVIFLRFNPNQYKKNNIVILTDIKERLKILSEQIKLFLQYKSLEKNIMVVKLFYNCNCVKECNGIHNIKDLNIKIPKKRIVISKMYKKCKKCEKEFPKTLEYFYKAYKNEGKIIFQSKCKKCYNKNKKSKSVKKIRKIKTHKTCKHCKKTFPATTDYFYPHKKSIFNLIVYPVQE